MCWNVVVTDFKMPAMAYCLGVTSMHVTCCYSYSYPFSNHIRGLKLFREWRKMWLCVKFSFNRNADSFV